MLPGRSRKSGFQPSTTFGAAFLKCGRPWLQAPRKRARKNSDGSPSDKPARANLKLAVAVESRQELDWLRVLSLDAVGIEVFVLRLREDDSPLSGTDRVISSETRVEVRGQRLPSFAEIVKALETEQPNACLVMSDDVFARVVTLAADILRIPVFLLVTSREQLANTSRRQKIRPDVFLIADASLFPLALSDDRYGSTLLPTGHPGRDLVVSRSPSADPAFSAPSLGDGQAGSRIRSAIDRWHRSELDPEKPDLSIIVPAYREARNLPLVCDRLLATLEEGKIRAEILLVDDASPDETYAVA